MTEFQLMNEFPCELSKKGILQYFAEELKEKMPEWIGQLSSDPSSFSEIEIATLRFSQEIAGLLIAIILGSCSAQEAIKKDSNRIRNESPRPLKNGYRKPRYVKLLCGMVLLIATLYCVPRRLKKKPGAPRGAGRRGKEGTGLYPEWSALGISEGVSPALKEEVARTAVLVPSFEIARDEIARRGVALDIKTVRRLTEELGGEALSARNAEMEKWRRGELPQGDYLSNKKVAIAMDGGRARTREERKKGPKTKKGRNRFDTPWREPKLMTLYVVGKKGRIEKKEIREIDGTMQGPDHLMDLVSYHLHRLGAARAKRIVFLGDGTEWIWNRIPLVAKRVELKKGCWFSCLDVSHAMGQISKALESVKDWTSKRKKKELTRLRNLLLKDKLDGVLKFLQNLCKGRRGGAVGPVIKYLEKRRNLMEYGKLKRLGMPIGSGAVESTIRRVVNLRIKSPGTFWYEENVERVMYLRAQVLSGRWEEKMEDVKNYRRLTRERVESWNPTPYSLKDPKNEELKLKPILVEV